MLLLLQGYGLKNAMVAHSYELHHRTVVLFAIKSNSCYCAVLHERGKIYVLAAAKLII